MVTHSNRGMLIAPDRLVTFSSRIFQALGASEDKASEVASHLVEANLKGHDSHGVGMIPNYVYGAKRGHLRVKSDAKLVRDKGSVLLVDGNRGFGQVVARQATDMGITRAKENGMVCVGSRNNYHIGRVGTYGEQCAREGLISIHFVMLSGIRLMSPPGEGGRNACKPILFVAPCPPAVNP